MGYLKRLLYLFLLRKKWRKKNSHNQTTIKRAFDINRVTVGHGTYGQINVSTFDALKDEVLSIGNYCSIAGNVHFICGGNHFTDRFLTYPIEKKLFQNGDEALSKGKIEIEDDVWIGTNALILSGVHIGRGAVIAAGNVVTKDVPAYSIVGGNPAKLLKYRFDKEIIQKLSSLPFEKVNNSFILSHKELFDRKLDMELADRITNELNSP